MPVRRALKIRTVFNLLGPLLNPAHAAYGLVGVYSPSISHVMADALQVTCRIGRVEGWGGKAGRLGRRCVVG